MAVLTDEQTTPSCTGVNGFGTVSTSLACQFAG